MTSREDSKPDSRARAAGLESQGEVLRIVVIYAAFASAWILFSDRIAGMLFGDPATLMLVSVIKGWVFVATTAVLLYWLMRRRLGAASRAIVPQAFHSRLAVALLALTVAAITALAIKMTYTQHGEREAERLQTIADLKTRQIAEWLKERRGDAHFLSVSGFYAEYYQRWREQGDAASLDRLQKRLDQFREDNGIAAISLLDDKGALMWGSEKAPKTLPPLLTNAVHRAAGSRMIKLVGPYRDQSGRPRLDYVVPLVNLAAPTPSLVLHIDPEDWLFATLRSWPTPSASGETLLFRREGDHILFLNELRHRRDTAAKLELPLDSSRVLAVQVARGDVEPGRVLEGVDYRNVPAVGVVRHIPGSDWYLVAKLDRAEYYGQALRDSVWITLVGILVLFTTLAVMYLMRQRQELAMGARLSQSQAERLRALRLLATIADSSEDAILAKDLEGRYLLFNRAAEAFTGKSAEEVLGRDDYILFPPDEAKMLQEHGRQVIAENRVITVEEVLTTPHGARTFLATKGPLHDDHGAITGIYSISRDITQRKKAEESLSDQMNRFRFLLDHSRDGIVIIDQDHRIVEANQRFADMLGYEREALYRLRTWDFEAKYDERAIREDFSDISSTNLIFETRHRRQDGSVYDVEISASGTHWAGQELVLCICRDITQRKHDEATRIRQTEELRRRNEELERFNRVSVGRELDMIDLKQRINELSRLLDREPPYPLAFADALDDPGGEKSP